MKTYTVHEPAPPAVTLEGRADSIVFVKEGFSWLGFFLPPVFMIVNALWFELLGLIVLSALLTAGIASAGLKDLAPGLASLFVGFLIGFEGNDLRRWRLTRKHYTLLGSVVGANRSACEQRFFKLWLPFAANEQAAPQPPRATPMGGMQTAGGRSSASMHSWHGPTIIGNLS